MNMFPFDPLTYENLGQSLISAVLARPIEPIQRLSPFEGPGLYAIYYTGHFRAYQEIAERNRGSEFSMPIYIGKAEPAGARKGGRIAGGGTSLYKRLSEHIASLVAASDPGEQFMVEDFFCRYLVVTPVWIPLGESMLIDRFRPIWNVLIDGFGNHPPGENRAGKRSAWDTIHPGRPWAAPLKDHDRSRAELIERVREHVSIQPQ
ncbi:MAG: Eco29kI family restriction endonuclease [Oscillochloris sp.]|nr:Eco29kI family restriction endonuclease [Oscillochloris sp.]